MLQGRFISEPTGERLQREGFRREESGLYHEERPQVRQVQGEFTFLYKTHLSKHSETQ